MGEVDVLRAQVILLREAHEKCNGALRSMMAVANRDGRETNWPNVRAALRESLETSHMVLNALADADKRSGAPDA